MSRGVFTVPDGLRGAFQNASPATLAGLVNNAINSTPQVSIRSFRERMLVTYAYQVRPSLEVKIQYMNERRSGNRLWSSGSYNRIGTPVGDTFETPGQEIFEPTAYRTNEPGAEVNYSRKNVFLSVEYRASHFNNAQRSL